MDLSSMLNDGPAPGRKKQSSQTQTPPEAAPRTSSSQRYSIPPTPGSNGGVPAGYASHQTTTPLHAPPPGPPSLSRQSTGLTPLQTPSQSSYGPGGQYPFPSQSPAVQQPAPLGGHAHPASGSYSATTPGARPPSHGFQHPAPSPSQYQAYGSMPAPHPASHSPTPSSHPSQTPHSVRHSPMATMTQGPPQQQQQQQQQQQHSHQPPPLYHQTSQPSTPLGPPPLQYSRHSHHPNSTSYPDSQSPYHVRHASTTSNGTSTPAQHHPSIGNMIESPSAYNPNRSSPQVIRRTSEYLSQMVERERSLSVSPKTKVLPRTLSQGSRQSSQQQESSGFVSGRSSLQHQQRQSGEGYVQLGSAAGSVSSQSHLPQAGPGSAQSAAAQQNLPGPQASVQGYGDGMPSQPVTQPSLQPHSATQSPQASIQHQSQKMGMNHLLAPAGRSGAEEASAALAKAQQEPSVPVQEVGVQREPPVKMEGTSSNKRPASSEASAEPPAKREKLGRKYGQRPIWAQLHPKNPRYKASENGPIHIGGRAAMGQAPLRQPNGVPTPQQHRAPPPPRAQTNGHAVSEPSHVQQPGDPPIDEDLLRARQIFSTRYGGWEKTIQWNEPIPELHKQVQDWLYLRLSELSDIPPASMGQGHIEIEAKIGKILRNGTDERLSMPITSPAVLDQGWAEGNVRFESQMGLHEHKAMNTYLNTVTKTSHDTPGRIKIVYNHPLEQDSFSPLSSHGLASIPPVFRRHITGNRDRDLRLRTTRDLKTRDHAVTARIVKVRVADLHIYNPAADYDCRISLNLEIDLLHAPHLPPWEELVAEYKPGEKAPPDRTKDRLSYSHLAYRIDLTKVEVGKGLAPKYELELEVDAEVLREQLLALNAGQPSGFGDVVSGFLGNAGVLMRLRAGAG